MDYAELPLPPALAGLVAAVWTLAASQPGWVEHEATPDGCVELIRRHAGRSEWRRDQPEFFATGLSDRPIRFGFSGDARFTAIKLWPWAWHALGGAPCPGFADDWIAVAPDSALAMLLQGDPVANLAGALASAVPPPLARAILASDSVATIAARTGLPHRRLQRIFARELGLAPRTYLRLLRFREALQDVQQGADTLAGTAAARGYADQAHMARDFRALAGMPPSNARARARGPFLQPRPLPGLNSVLLSSGEREGGPETMAMARWQGLERARPALFALFLLVALAVRWPAYGEWNYAVDDQYFALVGRRLLAGDLLYVDIWDRKPPLLYLTYAAIARIQPSALAYQLVATVFAALGGYGTARIARLIAPLPAAPMAGIAYCVLLTRFGGGNGEAAVFYNPLILATAWSIAASIAQLRRGVLPPRVLLGMFTAGLAIGFKQSAGFEALFFGIATLAILARSGMDWRALAVRAAAMAALGALPLAAIGLAYWWMGHFPQLWQALVLSNFARAYDAGRMTRALALAGLLCLPLLFAVLGYLRGRASRPAPLDFLACWAVAATLAVAIFPGLYLHYALPLLAPLAILGAPFFARPGIGALGFAALLVLNLATSDMFDLPVRARARPAAAALVEQVRQVTPHGRLLVFGMPSYLYAAIGSAPPTILAFPAHFYEGAESGASGIDEVAELRRVLRAEPETVVVQEPLPAAPLNEANVAQVIRYVRRCEAVRRMTIYDHEGEKRMAVHSGCARAAPTSPPAAEDQANLKPSRLTLAERGDIGF